MRDVAGPVAVSVVVGALVAGVAWAIGVNVRQSVVLAVCVVAAGAGRGVLAIQQRASGGDQWRGRWTLTRGGGRRDVRQLAWRLRADQGRVHRAALQRLRRVAEQRLRPHGIDLADPAHVRAAEALLGTTAYRVLTADRDRIVRYAAFAQAVDAIERLHPPDPAARRDPATAVARERITDPDPSSSTPEPR